ncbi:uncharacterized protein LOC120665227 isoform X4 [Panicum virgatum]|uniref:uncharacterized protein LOC120665227 isoform X4 n=1 Tax=Panicum virgatum TaxID=38727 RepID=UPI0019D587E6|nr:uncharacterized protein LOC120665227 isoform X4 [Panicum virgatum]
MDDPTCVAARAEGKKFVSEEWVQDSLDRGVLADADRLLPGYLLAGERFEGNTGCAITAYFLDGLPKKLSRIRNGAAKSSLLHESVKSNSQSCLLPSSNALLLWSTPQADQDVKLVYKTMKEKTRECNRRDPKFYGNMFAKWRKLEHMDTKKAEPWLTAKIASSIREILSRDIHAG